MERPRPYQDRFSDQDKIKLALSRHATEMRAGFQKQAANISLSSDITNPLLVSEPANDNEVTVKSVIPINLAGETDRPYQGSLIKLSTARRASVAQLLAISFVALANADCAHIQRKMGIGKPTQSEALRALDNGNFILASKYYDDKLCEPAEKKVMECEKDKKAAGCQMAEITAERCEQVEDGVNGTIDYFMGLSKQLASKDKYIEAIYYVKQALAIMDTDDELRIDLAKEKAGYKEAINKARTDYRAELTRLEKLLSSQEKISDEDWDGVRRALESLRKKREITHDDDERLFSLAVGFTKRFYRNGVFKRASIAASMARNVDLGETNFKSETQITTEIDSLFGAVDGKLQELKDEARGERKEIMDKLYTIELKLNKFLKMKYGSAASRALADGIQEETDKLYFANKSKLNAKLRERFRDVDRQISRKKSNSGTKSVARRIEDQRRRDAARAAKTETASSTEKERVRNELAQIETLFNQDKFMAYLRLVRAVNKKRDSKHVGLLKRKLGEWKDLREKIIQKKLDEIDLTYKTDKNSAYKMCKQVLEVDPGNASALQTKGQIERLRKIRANQQN